MDLHEDRSRRYKWDGHVRCDRGRGGDRDPARWWQRARCGTGHGLRTRRDVSDRQRPGRDRGFRRLARGKSDLVRWFDPRATRLSPRDVRARRRRGAVGHVRMALREERRQRGRAALGIGPGGGRGLRAGAPATRKAFLGAALRARDSARPRGHRHGLVRDPRLRNVCGAASQERRGEACLLPRRRRTVSASDRVRTGGPFTSARPRAFARGDRPWRGESALPR